MDRSGLIYWESFAPSRFRSFPHPLVLGDEDIGFLEGKVTALHRGKVEAMLLGVTPGIATMRWPPDTSLVAVDWSHSMIRNLWPRDGLPHFACAVRADWRELPLANASRTLVVGDGCYTAMGTLAGMALLNEQVHRTLKPGGFLCLRCYARPEPPESPDKVCDDALGGRIPNIFVFRWLFAMAVHGNAPEGVALDSVWRAWVRCVPEPREFLARCGWPQDAAWSIERWKGLDMRYVFPSPAELRGLAAPLFDVLEYRVPSYRFGERFPFLLLRARG